MALIECPECGEEISEKAEACPNCGVPLSPPRESSADGENFLTRNRGCGDIFIFGGLLLVVLLLFAVGSC